MSLGPSTRLVHSAPAHTDGEPACVPIALSTVLTSAGDPELVPFSYTRLGNPTWSALEAALEALEGAPARVFASGQAAGAALLLALAERAPRVVVPHDGYYGMRKLLDLLAGRGIASAPCDHGDLAAVERELARAPSILWTETPTNPFLRVFDLRALAALAARHGAAMVVDNTTATAALQRPLELGATATLTSLTKSTSGHSDVLLGSVATRDGALLERVGAWRTSAGGIPGPFEAWLALRGLKTLPLRVERQSTNALALARHLEVHPRVRRVHYPGLGAALELASAQMQGGFGPLLSFELDGDAAAAERVVRAGVLMRPSTSFGGLESSWERRARWSSETAPESLIRTSAGIEDAADLIADLDRALSAE